MEKRGSEGWEESEARGITREGNKQNRTEDYQRNLQGMFSHQYIWIGACLSIVFQQYFWAVPQAFVIYSHVYRLQAILVPNSSPLVPPTVQIFDVALNELNHVCFLVATTKTSAVGGTGGPGLETTASDHPIKPHDSGHWFTRSWSNSMSHPRACRICLTSLYKQMLWVMSLPIWRVNFLLVFIAYVLHL